MVKNFDEDYGDTPKQAKPADVQWDKEAKAKADAEVKEPEVKKPEPPKFTKIAASEDKYDSLYPFHDMKPGEGFFVSDDDVKGNTLNVMRTEVYNANMHYSVPTHDVNGDEVWENVMIHGHNSGVKSVEEKSVPKHVHTRFFSVKPVVKGDVVSGTTKAPADGVVVMREH